MSGAGLAGLTIVAFESRRAAELANLVTHHGGRAVQAPSSGPMTSSDVSQRPSLTPSRMSSAVTPSTDWGDPSCRMFHRIMAAPVR